jgi:hypothetical protein
VVKIIVREVTQRDQPERVLGLVDRWLELAFTVEFYFEPCGLAEGKEFQLSAPRLVLFHVVDVLLDAAVVLVQERSVELALLVQQPAALRPVDHVDFLVALDLVCDRPEQTVAVAVHILDAEPPPVHFFIEN